MHKKQLQEYFINFILMLIKGKRNKREKGFFVKRKLSFLTVCLLLIANVFLSPLSVSASTNEELFHVRMPVEK